MAFVLYVKSKGCPSGDALTIYKNGQVNVSCIKDIDKFKSVEIFVDRERKLVGFVFSEKHRMKSEIDTFAILSSKPNHNSFYVDIRPVLKDLGIVITNRLVLPYEIIKKMYVLDFSKI
jgi:hypothetical protein